MRESKDSLLDQFSRSSCDSCGEARYEGKVSADECPPTQPDNKKASRPTRPCDGPRMNPSVDVGNPPRPFRHLRMAERCSPDPSSSRVPVHSALVQKSVTAITNPAGRLSLWMLGKSRALGKWKTAKSWQVACNQSNHQFTNGLARRCVRRKLWDICPIPEAFTGKIAENARENAKNRAIASACGTTEGLDSAGDLCIYTKYENTESKAESLVFWRDAGEVSVKSKLRTPAFAGGVILMLVHGAVLALRYGTEAASRWGDWIGTASILLAAVVCWSAARRSGSFGKRVWRLVFFSLVLALLGQVAYTYYFDYLHVPPATLWPSDILVFFWVVPAMMTLFLSPRDPNSGFRWLRICDLAQARARGCRLAQKRRCATSGIHCSGHEDSETASSWRAQPRKTPGCRSAIAWPGERADSRNSRCR